MSAVQAGAAVVRQNPSEFDLALNYVKAVKPDIVEQIELPARSEKLAPIPKSYTSGELGARLRAVLPASGKLWSHQALALEKLEDGENVLIATGTGSGKSLVFQLPIIRDLLEGKGTHLVLYPQKALSSDQLRRWYDKLEAVGLSRDLLGEINGDVPMEARETIIHRSRLVLATPDVLHAWLMRFSQSPSVKRFVASLTTIAIDEAHAFDGVMGSNSAFLMRRLRLAVKRASGEPSREPLFIATSATIENPRSFAEKLTGVPFSAIGDHENGAPSHKMTILHVEGPESGSAAETYVSETIEALHSRTGNYTLLAFMDARQGIERISRKFKSEHVLPYRSGYELEDRMAIESALHSGTLTACVSTSALELGIDIAGFGLGLNVGVPQSRKSLRQRIGRVGRHHSGVFVIAASKNAFTKLGTTLEEFARGTVEPSHLYLENEIIQFQQACCLMDEIGGKEQIDEAMHLVDWPKGFGAAIGYAVPGADCPRGFNRPTKYAGGCAHLYFPLRRISDKNFKLRYANNPDQVIGQIGHEQALREAFAGATYIHNRNAYRVMEWKSIAFGQSIHVQPIVNGPPTRPIINRKVGFSLNSEDLLDGRYKSSSAGSLAETSIQVTESVLGYSVAGKDRMYRDIQADDRRMQIQTRTFETTGIVLQFSASALSGEGTAKTEKRSAIAKALRAILSSLHGIQLGEIGWAVSGVSRHDEFGPTKIDDAIIIFDDIKGGLRLTRPLYCDFRRVLGRLRVGAEKAGDECLLSQDMLEYLEHWFAGLELSVPLQQEHGSALGIFAPGSVVGAQVNGRLRLCKLLGHHYVEMSGSTMLMYEYEVSNGAKAWIAASALEPIGDQWKLLLSQEAQGGVK